MFNYAHLAGESCRGQAHVREDSPESDVVGITYTTLQRIMTQKKWGELMQLYVFYAKETKRQRTQQVYATTGFAAKGCGWDDKKVKRVKKRLIEMGLIEDIKPSKREDGTFGKPYIRVRFIAKPPTGGDSLPGGEEPPQMLTDSKGSAYRKKSKETKETASVDAEGFKAKWKLDGRTKEEKLSTIRRPKRYPSEWDFDNFIEDEDLIHLINKRADLYRTLCIQKWHHWDSDLAKWRPIMDWRRYVESLNNHIGNVF